MKIVVKRKGLEFRAPVYCVAPVCFDLRLFVVWSRRDHQGAPGRWPPLPVAERGQGKCERVVPNSVPSRTPVPPFRALTACGDDTNLLNDSGQAS